MATSLTKGKGITDDPSLQREPTSWKDGIDPSIMPNPNSPCEQEELRKIHFCKITHNKNRPDNPN